MHSESQATTHQKLWCDQIHQFLQNAPHDRHVSMQLLRGIPDPYSRQNRATATYAQDTLIAQSRSDESRTVCAA
jgi:hypothetical protein